MAVISVLLFVSLPYFVWTQVVTNPEPLISAGFNDTVHLSCRFVPPIDGCYWLKDDGVVEIEDRYQYTGDFNEGDCSMAIRDIGEADSGQWTCGSPQTSSGRRGSKSKPTQITVYVPPTMTFVYNGIKLDNGEKLYVYSYPELQTLACSVRTQMRADQVDVKWFAEITDGTVRPVPVTVKQLTFGKNVNLINSLMSSPSSAVSTKRITCQLTIKGTQQIFEAFVRILQPN